MPQFDATTFASQLFWLYVSFALLFLLMSTIAMPKIGSVLEERQRKIDDNLDRAGQLKIEAEAAIAAYEKALAESRAEAQTILQAGQLALAKQAEERQRELGATLAARIKAGEARIFAAKDQALAQVHEVAAEVARLAAEKLTGVPPDQALVTAAVAAAVKDRS
jgi:F-type H+-transporting ATPase subunit b